MSFKVLPGTTPHQPPFVLMEGKGRIEPVFQSLRLLHLRGMARQTLRAYRFKKISENMVDQKGRSPSIACVTPMPRRY